MFKKEDIYNVYDALEASLAKFQSFVDLLGNISILETPEEKFIVDVLRFLENNVPYIIYAGAFLTPIDIETESILILVEKESFQTWYSPKVPEIPEKVVQKFDLINWLKNSEFEAAVPFFEKLPNKEIIVYPIKLKKDNMGFFFFSFETFFEQSLRDLENLEKIIAPFYILRRYNKYERIFHQKIISILLKALGYFDNYTKTHLERVGFYGAELAKFLKLDKQTVRRIYWAGLLHDTGKLVIPQHVLNKKAPLAVNEYISVKSHAKKSYELIKSVNGLEDIAFIVKHHHERWDGKGYPDKLKGEDIPLESRILAVADSFDAMTSQRPYRAAFTMEAALNELNEKAGTQFDPSIVKAAIQLFPTIFKG
ncbi:HD-GYP domain-containing protein [Thermosipho ferrireducens]|uniref:HD-GYP domain-containing protein n=1 Tax=Thermosipho ferrireducens TaxID=2571116 RepID=A0ABX7SAI3_9BACT|nr:HD-GYP domain-containing protein [Thermosipho ferrireducens]QTA38295.1 HD-GYP domain-containing protein [Thermosipho ferrireducens]